MSEESKRVPSDIAAERRKIILKILDISLDRTCVCESEKQEKIINMIKEFFFHVECREGTMRKGLIIWENIWDEMYRLSSEDSLTLGALPLYFVYNYTRMKFDEKDNHQKRFIKGMKFMGKLIFDEMHIVEFNNIMDIKYYEC